MQGFSSDIAFGLYHRGVRCACRETRRQFCPVCISDDKPTVLSGQHLGKYADSFECSSSSLYLHAGTVHQFRPLYRVNKKILYWFPTQWTILSYEFLRVLSHYFTLLSTTVTKSTNCFSTEQIRKCPQGLTLLAIFNEIITCESLVLSACLALSYFLHFSRKWRYCYNNIEKGEMSHFRWSTLSSALPHTPGTEQNLCR